MKVYPSVYVGILEYHIFLEREQTYFEHNIQTAAGAGTWVVLEVYTV